MPGIVFIMSSTGGFGKDPFPLHAICGAAWNNAEGQISFLRYAVSASPGIFTFVHSARQLWKSCLVVLTCWMFYANLRRWAMLMFVFGVKALEQFVDRLVEWPRYCNQILQISHLR
ncbi:hypothetical protein MKW94_019738, partial [Papaver nudicaule]|nr:hypothetical protein [Papaver nudicaule]